jgi:hypothetical protein
MARLNFPFDPLRKAGNRVPHELRGAKFGHHRQAVKGRIADG